MYQTSVSSPPWGQPQARPHTKWNRLGHNTPYRRKGCKVVPEDFAIKDLNGLCLCGHHKDSCSLHQHWHQLLKLHRHYTPEPFPEPEPAHPTQPAPCLPSTGEGLSALKPTCNVWKRWLLQKICRHHQCKATRNTKKSRKCSPPKEHIIFQ